MAGGKKSGRLDFVHLRTHSAYSLQEGAVGVEKLIGAAIVDHQPALAITDTANMFCALEFSEKASKKGLQPIVGCSFELDFGLPQASGRGQQSALQSLPSMVFYCQNEEGYENLTGLISQAYMAGVESGRLCLQIDELSRRSAGLICLTGGPTGPLNMTLADNRSQDADRVLDMLKLAFGDRLYIELQRFENYDREVEHALMSLAIEHDLPVVATNEEIFATAEDYDAHDALLCI